MSAAIIPKEVLAPPDSFHLHFDDNPLDFPSSSSSSPPLSSWSSSSSLTSTSEEPSTPTPELFAIDIPRTVSDKDFLSNQPAELTFRVLEYLSAKDLTVLAGVSWHLRKLANDDCLWKELCRVHWADKKHQTLELHPRVDYTQIVNTLTEKDMRGILRRRFQTVDHNAGREELARLVKTTVPAPGMHWILRRMIAYTNKWKASYIAAELDSTRSAITEKELIHYDWMYYDAWMGMNEHHKVRFYEDGTREGTDPKYPKPRRRMWSLENGQVQVSEAPYSSIA
ncbi:hypothetical protein HK102_005147 [Quaeritorhiza haematococci]|nr:hypothetical protein HK102_005147 [Quaeritorhiza haematococci]